MHKSDFPIFVNTPDLVYLDNGASTQKPQHVIDGVNDFLTHSYANIHRGLYAISERAEELYHASKEAVARLLGCKTGEIFYTYNSTYGINIIAQSLVRSGFLKKGDVVLLGIWEHHSNVLPWQILGEQFGFEVKFFGIHADYTLDREDFAEKYDDRVKVVACAQVSNVTGAVYDVKAIKQKLREDTFFLIDGSQSVPHFPVNVEDIGCDCLVFTGHKMLAYTGIGGVFLKKHRVRHLTPLIAGGGTVDDVSEVGHSLVGSIAKFEAGTPNIIGAVSLLKAIEYIDSVGGMQAVWEHEQKMCRYVIEKIGSTIHDGCTMIASLQLVGPMDPDQRVATFSFVLDHQKNFQLVGETFAQHNICIRCGGHCAYPLHKSLKQPGTCRMSLYLYNDEADVDKFFEVLETIK